MCTKIPTVLLFLTEFTIPRRCDHEACQRTFWWSSFCEARFLVEACLCATRAEAQRYFLLLMSLTFNCHPVVIEIFLQLQKMHALPCWDLSPSCICHDVARFNCKWKNHFHRDKFNFLEPKVSFSARGWPSTKLSYIKVSLVPSCQFLSYEDDFLAKLKSTARFLLFLVLCTLETMSFLCQIS